MESARRNCRLLRRSGDENCRNNGRGCSNQASYNRRGATEIEQGQQRQWSRKYQVWPPVNPTIHRRKRVNYALPGRQMRRGKRHVFRRNDILRGFRGFHCLHGYSWRDGINGQGRRDVAGRSGHKQGFTVVEVRDKRRFVLYKQKA